MSEPQPLLLRETGIARLADGSEAVNVGPIVAALGFLTEGRGEDRGTDEQGTPLPDLLSLAFDVVQSIILGGRQADYFRGVKRDFDAEFGLDGRASLSLAKHAAAVRHSSPSTALEKAATELRSRLKQLDELSLREVNSAELMQAVEGFRGFGADRWVTATAHLLVALGAVGNLQPTAPRARRKKRKAAKPRAVVAIAERTKAKAKPEAKAKPKAKGKAEARPTKKAAKRRR